MARAATAATTVATSRASGGGARCRGPQGAPSTTTSNRTAAPPPRPTPPPRAAARTRGRTRAEATRAGATTSDLSSQKPRDLVHSLLELVTADAHKSCIYRKLALSSSTVFHLCSARVGALYRPCKVHQKDSTYTQAEGRHATEHRGSDRDRRLAPPARDARAPAGAHGAAATSRSAGSLTQFYLQILDIF